MESRIIVDRGYMAGNPPILGINGTSTEQRLVGGDLNIFYVNAAHALANDGNDGLDPQFPLATIQELVDRSTGASVYRPAVQDYETIYVQSAVTESVLTGTNTQMPSYVSLIGVGPGGFNPGWTSDGAALPCLTLNCEGWRVSGFDFHPPATAAAVLLNEIPASDFVSYKTTIQNCTFDGLWSGLYGIQFVGSPHRVAILNNWFVEINNGADTAFCIYVTDSSNANPYQCSIIGNRFSDSDNYIGNLNSDRGFNVSLFMDNIFETGVLLTPTIYLDLRGGSRGDNIVTRNVFCGIYSVAGGYAAHAVNPGMWVGNFAQDVASPQVADNGLTIAPPV